MSKEQPHLTTDLGEVIADLQKTLTAAAHALRSYEYGNGAAELAKSVADECEAALKRAKERLEDAAAREQVAPVKLVNEDGGLFVDFSDGIPNDATVQESLRRVPRGFILPADAPMALENELTGTGHEVRRVQ